MPIVLISEFSLLITAAKDGRTPLTLVQLNDLGIKAPRGGASSLGQVQRETLSI